MKKTAIIPIAMLICCAACFRSDAQLSLSAQFRTRTELRDGQGAPLPKGANPAFFTSQRTRLNFGYTAYRLKFGVALQDVRVWGQDVSTINRTTIADNNGIMLHEAWAEVQLTDTSLKNKALSLKIGRQELVYDDQRLIGNLDWLQQGRRHDAAVLKYETKAWMIHLAAAFNQNKESASGTVYNSTPPGNYTSSTNGGTMYKSMQFLYAGRKLKSGSASFLFFADQFSKYKMDTVNSNAVKTFEQGSWGRATTGFFATNQFHKTTATASAYYQFGKTAANQNLSALLLSASAQYAFNKKFSAAAGIDHTSGGSNGTTSNTFDPLYGTPHKFWGSMDYFYASSQFGKGGLTDYYIKAKYKASDKFLLSTDFHQFNSSTNIGTGENRRNLGQELDVVASYSLIKQVVIEGGYAHYFSTPLLTSSTVKNVPDAKSNANWAYVMINIRPDFLFK